MSAIKVIDNPFVTLWYHPDTKIVHHRLHRFIHGKDLRELLTTGCELMRDHGAQKWLSDDRDNTVLAEEDVEWGKANWTGRAVALGWRHWAIVRPQKVLAQVGMEHRVKELSVMGLNARFFDDPDEAMRWLEKQ